MLEMFFHGGDIFLFELFLQNFHFHLFLFYSGLFIFGTHLNWWFDGNEGMELMCRGGFSQLEDRVVFCYVPVDKFEKLTVLLLVIKIGLLRLDLLC